MLGTSLNFGEKRDFTSALVFFLVHLVFVTGLSTVLVHFLGTTDMIDVTVTSFFEGGEIHTLIGTLFVLWLGGMILTKRGLTSDIMSIIVVLTGLYLAWTTSVILGLVPIALLTTMNK